MIRRAIHAANTSLVAAASDAANFSNAQGSDGNSVRDLVNVIKKEEVTVTIDLFNCINVRFRCTVCHLYFLVPVFLQGIKMEGLPDSCFPTAEAANKLATLRARDLKAKIVAPFPYIEMSLFVPSWADEVVRLLLMLAFGRSCMLFAVGP